MYTWFGKIRKNEKNGKLTKCSFIYLTFFQLENLLYQVNGKDIQQVTLKMNVRLGQMNYDFLEKVDEMPS